MTQIVGERGSEEAKLINCLAAVVYKNGGSIVITEEDLQEVIDSNVTLQAIIYEDKVVLTSLNSSQRVN